MEDPTTIDLRIDDEGYESVDVQPIGDGRFILQNTPVWCNLPHEEDEDKFLLNLGDGIETEVLADGTHRLVAYKHSPLRHYSRLVPQTFVESKEYPKFFAAVEAAGGWVEGVMGGLLFVHLPPDSAFDPLAELKRSIAAAEEAGPDPDGPRRDPPNARRAHAVMRTKPES